MKRFDSEVNCGYLRKSPPTQNNSNFQLKSWHRRWFVLNCSRELDFEKSHGLPGKSTLNYYKDEQAWLQGRQCKGSISMSEVVDVKVFSGLPHALELKVPTRVYYLKAENDQERDEWLKSIVISLGMAKMTMWFQFYNNRTTSNIDLQPVRSKAEYPFEAEDVHGWPVCTFLRAVCLGQPKRSKSIDCLASVTSDNEMQMDKG